MFFCIANSLQNTLKNIMILGRFKYVIRWKRGSFNVFFSFIVNGFLFVVPSCACNHDPLSRPNIIYFKRHFILIESVESSKGKTAIRGTAWRREVVSATHDTYNVQMTQALPVNNPLCHNQKWKTWFYADVNERKTKTAV